MILLSYILMREKRKKIVFGLLYALVAVSVVSACL